MEKLKKIIAKRFKLKVEDIKPTDELINDYNADSIEQIEIIMDFEDKYGINIPDEDVEKLKTVQDCFDYVNQKVKK